MANDFFHFKQFSIYQNHCAMKVGIDGVLLGAWCKVENLKKILDVGTGTGILALMIAQRTMAEITAIEIEPEASIQARENFRNSPWNERLMCIAISFQDFLKSNTMKYDAVVCNPPFFQDAIHPKQPKRILARHSVQLSCEELILGVAQLLSHSGKLFLIYPYEQLDMILKIAEKNNLHPKHVTNVFPHSEKQPHRVLLELVKNYRGKPKYDNLIIWDNKKHTYSLAYKLLTQSYYIK
jgi:tRNA1Val (adenine37-N6)-methyltransferase